MKLNNKPENYKESEINPIGSDENSHPTDQNLPDELEVLTTDEPISDSIEEQPLDNETCHDQENGAECGDDNVDPAIRVEESTVASASKGNIVIKSSHLFIAAVTTIILLVGAFCFGLFFRGCEKTDPDIDSNAKDYNDVQADFGNPSEDSIAIPGYPEIVFPSDTKNVQVVLLNPKGNPCYFRFVLVLKDSGEEIYRSGLIPPGQAVTDITLTRPLAEGEYPLEIRIETASLEERIPMNGAVMETLLKVQ